MSNFHIYRSDDKIDQFYDTDLETSLVIDVTSNGELLIYEFYPVADMHKLVAAYQAGQWKKVTDTTYDTGD